MLAGFTQSSVLKHEQAAMETGRAALVPGQSGFPAPPPVQGNFSAQQTFTVLLGSTVGSVTECEQAA